MSKTKKFKRGNLVMILKGSYKYRHAVIDKAYYEKFGGGDRKNYSIILTVSGERIEWVHERHLKRIDKGSLGLFEEVKNINEKNSIIYYASINENIFITNESLKNLIK